MKQTGSLEIWIECRTLTILRKSIFKNESHILFWIIFKLDMSIRDTTTKTSYQRFFHNSVERQKWHFFTYSDLLEFFVHNFRAKTSKNVFYKQSEFKTGSSETWVKVGCWWFLGLVFECTGPTVFFTLSSNRIHLYWTHWWWRVTKEVFVTQWVWPGEGTKVDIVFAIMQTWAALMLDRVGSYCCLWLYLFLVFTPPSLYSTPSLPPCLRVKHKTFMLWFKSLFTASLLAALPPLVSP